MSAGSSIDFSEFLNGDILKQHFLSDCKTVRLSLDVQLEKIPTPQLNDVHKIVSPQNKTICAPTEKQTGADEATTENFDLSKSAHQQYLFLTTARASEQHNDATSTTTSEKSNKPVIRKINGVFSTSDRLRRISLRNISSKKFTSGRRTLLQEFESTFEDANFSPSIYSTPISQPAQNVSNVPKRYSKSKRNYRVNNAKRSLFNTQNSDASDETDGLAEKSNAVSSSCSRSKKLKITPPKRHQCFVTTPKVVSPPPAVTTSGMVADSTATGEILNNPKDISLPPSPPGFESDSGISTNNNYKNDTQQYITNVIVEVGTTNERIKTNPNVNNDSPTNPAPKRKYTKRAKIIAEESTTADSQISIDSSADRTERGTLRRSKRGQVPRCRPPILDILYQQELKRMEYSEMKRKAKLKKQEQEAEKEGRMLKTINNKNTEANSPSTVAKNVDAVSDCKSLKRKRKQSIQIHQNCSRLILSSLPLVAELNNIFDQLKQNSLISKAAAECSQTTPQYKIKPFQVRVRCLKSYDATPSKISSSSISSTSTNTTSNASPEWFSWLKNMSQACSDHPQAGEAFRQMRISSATNLQFTELQGVEYAFYDTAEKASLGYLRFKPLQVKPKKKAKFFDLHFINMMGYFRINVDGYDSFLGVGDMVAIEKSTYEVQNLLDDVSILMVIKK